MVRTRAVIRKFGRVENSVSRQPHPRMHRRLRFRFRHSGRAVNDPPGEAQRLTGLRPEYRVRSQTGWLQALQTGRSRPGKAVAKFETPPLPREQNSRYVALILQ